MPHERSSRETNCLQAVGPLAVPWFVLCGMVCYLPAALAAPSRSPSTVLAEDFSLVRSGQAWITRTEERLLARLAALPSLRTRIVTAEAALSQLADRNTAAWRQLQSVRQVVAQLEQGRAAAGDGAQRKSLQRELNRQREIVQRLEQQAVQPAELAGVPAVREQVVALSNDRNELLLSLLWIRQAATQLDEQYRILQDDPRVMAALEALGGGQQLGPLRNYAAQLGSLGSYEQLVFDSRVPLYRVGPRLRASLIVGDVVPATFTWQDSHQPTLVTTSLAEAAGIPVSASAPRERITVAPGRQVGVRSITIPYLRVGRHVVRDAPAWLLPPEAEDVGSQVGPLAFSGYRMSAEPEQFQLTIRPE